MPRRKAVRDPTTIWVDRSVKEELRKLKKRGEPYSKLIERLIKAYKSCREVGGY